MNNSNIITEGEKSLGKLSGIELDYTYWHSKDGWLIGYLDIWPEHLTQGHDLPELEEMLADLYEFYKEENEINLDKKTGKIILTA
ncbi:MAG: type II toxin-antitoxin system HicB family antitoxin [Treponema sp.]|jgi:predicted RNase H-like HicB family nuclease|nr:type II toxin-antitoxin system HicB family antitoxin [Treponema sp.]